MTAAQRYINRIRNTAKQSYAKAYRAYLLLDNEEIAPPGYAGLSYMAAQAVRLDLCKFKDSSGL